MDQRENSGVLFKNNHKKKDKHPDLTGTVNVTCTHCGSSNILDQSAWEKTSKRGEAFFSQSFRVKQERTEKHEPVRYETVKPVFDEEIPF